MRKAALGVYQTGAFDYVAAWTFAIVVIAAILTLAIFISGDTNQDTEVVQAPEVFTVSDVVASLDRHELTEEVTPFYAVIAASDGRKYIVDGDFWIEVYTYVDEQLIPDKLPLNIATSQMHIEGNLLIVAHTTDKAAMDKLLDDFKDG